mmetsp:Transcript_79874/g.226109  ORF Transcript_79874/g.226109 Transcript_79874/m.226109 type:complete len:237 (-) Transcript_79874:1015-1725(-)
MFKLLAVRQDTSSLGEGVHLRATVGSHRLHIVTNLPHFVRSIDDSLGDAAGVGFAGCSHSVCLTVAHGRAYRLTNPPCRGSKHRRSTASPSSNITLPTTSSSELLGASPPPPLTRTMVPSHSLVLGAAGMTGSAAPAGVSSDSRSCSRSSVVLAWFPSESKPPSHLLRSGRSARGPPSICATGEAIMRCGSSRTCVGMPEPVRKRAASSQKELQLCVSTSYESGVYLKAKLSERWR